MGRAVWHGASKSPHASPTSLTAGPPGEGNAGGGAGTTRPVDLHIIRAADGNGLIAERHSRGSETLYTVRLLSGQVIHSSCASGEPWRPGTRVRVTATPKHLIAFAPLKPWL